MKRILPSKSYHSTMKNISLALLVIFSIPLVLHVLIPYISAFSQSDNTTEMITSNKSTNPEVLYNGTGIMQNTSGIIDDAIDALKESFGPFFGK
jgi:hypothetical protein